MEPELAALAASGATTLVGLMASDAWEQLKTKVASVLGRGGAEPDPAVERELADSHSELLAARDSGDEAVVADLQAMWRLRLRRLLQEDPVFAGELRKLIADAAPAAAGGGVHNVISGGDFHGLVIQAGTIHGDISNG